MVGIFTPWKLSKLQIRACPTSLESWLLNFTSTSFVVYFYIPRESVRELKKNFFTATKYNPYSFLFIYSFNKYVMQKKTDKFADFRESTIQSGRQIIYTNLAGQIILTVMSIFPHSYRRLRTKRSIFSSTPRSFIYVQTSQFLINVVMQGFLKTTFLLAEK